uniref:Hypothetical chloroplast RF12 n=1 Tax=Chloropicon maureeniae TaxID=1461542 RepID=A0A4D6C5D3_9CHLO|nr:hypothetical chloroplast RF12 [Chloropicon maureeniae]QBX98229.1 hypothetical chloroplast RF12 [Chloropicon maureeniae]
MEAFIQLVCIALIIVSGPVIIFLVSLRQGNL